MRPDFEYMTIAELRTYCSYSHKVGNKTHKVLQDILKTFDNNNFEKSNIDRMRQKIKDMIKQMEVMGLASENNN